jgi:hypothetical protein
MTHPLSLSWSMIPFPQHPKLAFVFFLARGQGFGWLLGHLSACFTFTSMLCFHFDLIHHLASSLFMCECGHGLDASGTHLTHYPF